MRLARVLEAAQEPAARLCKSPEETAMIPASPLTWTGTVRTVFVPSPSSPKKFDPHVQAVPSDMPSPAGNAA